MGTPAIVINNNKNFNSITFDAAAKAAIGTNSIDVKMSGDLSVKGSNSFGLTAAGVKMDVTLLAVALEADFGQTMKFLNSVNLRACTADGKAVLAEADVLLTKAEKIVTGAETYATKMRSGVTTAKNGTTTVSTKGISAVM